jgi:iron complex outermembrane receptor protein
LLATAASFGIAHAAAAQDAAGAQSAPTPGVAQPAPNGPKGQAATELEEVVVTGTSIRGVAPVGSALTTVSRDDIKASGAISTVELLNKSPQVFNVGVSDSSRGNTGGSSNITYGSSINLRGISPYETLTLVDGFRMVRQEQRAETVDPSHIPTNMLQRVEIVADGGSAIYGSDAVVGVANLILRRRVEGVEVGARYGLSNLGYQERVGQITVGHVWDSGQFTAGIEYMHHNAIRQWKLSYDVRNQVPLGGTDIRQANCQPGNIQIGNTFWAIPEGGVTPATADQLVANTQNRCDYYKLGDANPKQERRSFAFTFNQDISDVLHFDAEGYASRRNFKLRVVPTSLTLVVPSTNAFFVAPPGVQVPLCSAATNANFHTPAGTRCETVLWNDIADVGIDKALYGYSQVFEGIAGFTLDLPFKWQGALHYTYGFNQDLNFDRSNERVNSANQNANLASSDPATALNVFGGLNNPAVIDANSPTGIFNQLFDTNGHTIQKVADLKLDGPLFHLPGGDIKAALGFQHYTMLWWSNNATGALTNPVWRTPQHVTLRHNSYFAEINVPLVGPANEMPFIKELELNIAGRIDDYADVGVTRNPKVGLRWKPIDDLVVHASYGTSFRSPNVLDLYQFSSNVNVSTFNDPTCGCNVVGLALSGGNPSVRPETAKTYSLGFDYQPRWLDGLQVSVNYFNLEIDKEIAAFLTDPNILTREAELAGTGVITRATLDQVNKVLSERAVTSGSLPADHSLIKVIIDGRPLNLGTARAAGFDITANYNFRTDSYGDFLVGVNGELFTEYRDQATPGSPFVNRLNTIFFPPKWRGRYYLGWNYGNFSGVATLNYLNGYTNTLVTPNQHVKAYTTTDLHMTYAVPGDGWRQNLTVGVDVTNLFDQDPPTVLGNGTGVLGTGGTTNFGGAGFDPTKAYIYGRLISLTLDKKF